MSGHYKERDEKGRVINPPERKATCAARFVNDLGHSRCGKKSPLSVTIVEDYVTCLRCRPDLRAAPSQGVIVESSDGSEPFVFARDDY